MNLLFAMAPPADGQGNGGGMIGTLIMFGAIFVIFYFMLVKPRQKKRNESNENRFESDSGQNFWNFGLLISRTLIVVLFYLGGIAIIFAGIYLIQLKQVELSIFIIVFGLLLWRIICEGAVVIFNIHDHIKNINYKLPSVTNQSNKNISD